MSDVSKEPIKSIKFMYKEQERNINYEEFNVNNMRKKLVRIESANYELDYRSS